MEQTSRSLCIFRSVVFGLTAGFFLYKMATADWSYFGGHFRFLTIWGLSFSTLSAWFMLRLSMGWTTRRQEVFASVTTVLNMTVLLMYWKIYLEDPALFYGPDGEPAPWYDEYFLHGLGPLMQIFDAIFLLGAFRPIRAIALRVAALPVAYLCWAEFLVRPLNELPAGEITNGLPYRFLNNLDVAGRAQFYLTTIISMLVLMLLAWGVAALVRRVRGAPSATLQSPQAGP